MSNKRFEGLLAAVGGFLIFFVGDVSIASAQTAPLKTNPCPSRDYYVAHANSKLVDADSRLDYTVCVLITTANRQIDLKTQIIVEATDAKTLRDKLITVLAGTNECGYSTLGGWEITELNLQFRRSGGSSLIRVIGQARDCQFLSRIGLKRLTYEVPLDYAYTNGVLSFGIREAQAVATLGGFGSDLVSSRLSIVLRDLLATMSININSFLPRFVSAFGPSLDRADLVLAGERVSLKLSGSGRLTGPAGDRLISETTRDLSVDQVLQLIKSSRRPSS